MKLIVGLGNPGKEYELNRHNVGFLAVDYLIDALNASKVSSKFKGELFKTSKYLFLKPQTFMNLSGESVVLVKNYYKIDNDDIIVIHDDIDLKLGALKFKKGGGHGGHNGLKSIDKHIGSDYYRIRIGVGRPEKKEDVVKYVLSDFTKDELECINTLFPKIKNAIEDIKNAASKYSQKTC
jgi:PTH1 family peptidyl-tRNA hydrolase